MGDQVYVISGISGPSGPFLVAGISKAGKYVLSHRDGSPVEGGEFDEKELAHTDIIT